MVLATTIAPVRPGRTICGMRIILGIGNPGAAYQHTRHNCGFAVVDELARRHALGEWRERWQSLTVEWRSAPGAGPALLLKPLTFVNGSGQAALAVLSYLKEPLTNLLVIVDDDVSAEKLSWKAKYEARKGYHRAVDIIACRASVFERERCVVAILRQCRLSLPASGREGPQGGLLIAAGTGFRKVHDLDELADTACPLYPKLAADIDQCRPLTFWATEYRHPPADESEPPPVSVIASIADMLDRLLGAIPSLR